MFSIRREKIIDQLLNKLAKNGSNKATLLEIKNDLLKLAKIDDEPKKVIEPVITQLSISSSDFLNQKNFNGDRIISGISSSIYVGGESDYSIQFYGGKTNFGSNEEVLENTLFDVASITKFFTLILKDKLVEYGIINANEKLSDLLSDFGDMQDFTLEDLSLLCGEIRTNGKITDAKTSDEALKILKTAYVYSNDRTTNKYNDFGAILTAIAITKRFNKINNLNYTFDRILDEIIFKPYDLNNTTFKPNYNLSVAGNGNLDHLVHDPKTRILGGVSGAAGLFTTTNDQIKFAKSLFNGNNDSYDYITDPVSPENIQKYGTVTFPNSLQSNKGHFGIYQKNKEYAKFFGPRDYSNGSFAIQGYTGSVMVFDPCNKIHNTIFVSAINNPLEKKVKDYPNFKEYITNDKADGFMDAFHIYQDEITKASLTINVLKSMLEMEQNSKNINEKVKIK